MGHIEDVKERAFQELRTFIHEDSDGNRVIDARKIEELVAALIDEGVTAAKRDNRSLPRKRSFRFDYVALIDACVAKNEKEGRDWELVSARTGISVTQLKQYFGPKCPKEIGTKPILGLLAWLDPKMDLIPYVIEE